jgi:hypothetical protein
LLVVRNVNGVGSVCDQETSKFLSLVKESMARTHGYKWSLLKVREEIHGEAQVEVGSQVFLLFRCFGKERTRRFQTNNQ